MYSHAPENYECPFCRLASGAQMRDGHTQPDDMIYHDAHVTGYLYDLTFQRRLTTPDERRPYAEKLKRYFDGRRLEITL